jgi:hypothetical protein
MHIDQPSLSWQRSKNAILQQTPLQKKKKKKKNKKKTKKKKKKKNHIGSSDDDFHIFCRANLLIFGEKRSTSRSNSLRTKHLNIFFPLFFFFFLSFFLCYFLRIFSTSFLFFSVFLLHLLFGNFPFQRFFLLQKENKSKTKTNQKQKQIKTNQKQKTHTSNKLKPFSPLLLFAAFRRQVSFRLRFVDTLSSSLSFSAARREISSCADQIFAHLQQTPKFAPFRFVWRFDSASRFVVPVGREKKQNVRLKHRQFLIEIFAIHHHPNTCPLSRIFKTSTRK